MSTPILAVEQLFDDVVTRFEDEAGQVSLLESANLFGSGALSGTPTEAAEVRIVFTASGVVGVAGIAYKVSTDDGVTYGSPVALGTGDTITVLGVTLTLGGSIALNDFVRWEQTSPTVPKFAFGTREPAKRDALPRIVFVPGDDSDVGEIGPVVKPGRNPRPLATLRELVTVYVEGFDSTAGLAENERAQWKATRLLFDAFVRAVYLAAFGTYEIRSTKWLNERSTRRHGYSIACVLSVGSMVPDAPAALAPVNVSADVATTAVIEDDASDQTDDEIVTAEDTP